MSVAHTVIMTSTHQKGGIKKELACGTKARPCQGGRVVCNGFKLDRVYIVDYFARIGKTLREIVYATRKESQEVILPL